MLLKKSENKEHNHTAVGNINRILSEEEISVLLKKLNVYQVELEMQNSELQVSYDTLEADREKFAS